MLIAITLILLFVMGISSELLSITCHVGPHNVTCHPTQVNTLCLNPSQTGQYSIYLSRRDVRLELSWCWL